METTFPAKVYQLFDGSGPGAYWFWSPEAGRWVVCDLDGNYCRQVERFMAFDVEPSSELEAVLGRGRADLLARVGGRVILTMDSLVLMLRDHPADVTNAVAYDLDGRANADPRALAVLRKLAGKVRNLKKSKPVRDAAPDVE